MNLPMMWAWLTAKLHMGEHDEQGANLVEYILLVVFIALVVIVAVTTLGETVRDRFNDAEAEL